MTIEACYQELDGSYADVLRRLPSPAFVERFMLKFPQDRSYQELLDALEAGNAEAAFRAVHTLKGVSANLSFTRLQAEASNVTECLRGGAITPDALSAMPALRQAYEQTIAAIARFQQEKENG